MPVRRSIYTGRPASSCKSCAKWLCRLRATYSASSDFGSMLLLLFLWPAAAVILISCCPFTVLDLFSSLMVCKNDRRTPHVNCPLLLYGAYPSLGLFRPFPAGRRPCPRRTDEQWAETPLLPPIPPPCLLLSLSQSFNV